MTQPTQFSTDGFSRNTNQNKTGKTNSRARGWCLTINNFSTEEVRLVKSSPAQLCVFQSEVGTSGTRHLQCVLHYTNARAYNSLKKEFPRAHIEQCRNLTASTNYCSKADTWDGKIRYYRKGEKLILDIDNNQEGRTEETALARVPQPKVKIEDKLLKELNTDFELNRDSWLKAMGVGELKWNKML